MIKRFFSFRNFLIGAIAAILVLTFFAKQYAFFSFDLYITKLIQTIDTPFVKELLLFITWLGNSTQSLFSLVIVSATLFIYGLRKESLVLILSTLGAVAISETLKAVILRPRPDPVLVNQIEKFFRPDSFPSGHVLFFMGFYGCLLFLAFVKIKKKSVRNFLTTILLGLIILVGISRIYLGSHWFSDTLASYLIGSIWLDIMILIYRRIHVK